MRECKTTHPDRPKNSSLYAHLRPRGFAFTAYRLGFLGLPGMKGQVMQTPKQKAASYQAHKAEIATRMAAYYQANKATLTAYAAAYYQANKAKVGERVAAYNRAHKAEMSATRAAYRQAHRDEMAAWVKANPDKCRDYSARRRARRKGATIEKVERAVVFDRDGGRCHICGKKVDPKHWHLDHITPLSKGGEHSYKNVAVSHPFCNMSKHNKTQDQLRLL